MKLMLQLIQWAVDMKLMIQWAVTSSALILIVLGVRYLFRKKLSARIRYALWGIVLLRLLVPFQVELPAAAPVPVLASNLAQDVTPWLDDTMLYAIPTEDQPYGNAPAGLPLQYARNGIPGDGWEYYTGGVVYDGEHITRYAVMLSALEVLVLIWFAGTALAALVILLSNLRFSLGLRKQRRRLEGVDVAIPVYVAEGLPSPCLFGLFRPAVYVTPAAAENPDTLRHVLAHELTHYAHKDHIWSLLRILALALHWYNPLVWLAVVLSKQDGELACDEGAIRRLGEGERIPYGRTLVDMVAARSPRPADLLSCSTAMTGGGKSIQQRVTQIVKKPETVKTALFATVALVALAVVFVFAGRGDDQILEAYRDTVIRAESVAFIPSLLPGIAYPTIIDDDSVSQAKEILLDISPLRSGEKPNLTDLASAPSVTLLGAYDINNLMQVEYRLPSQDGRTYVLAWSSQSDGSTSYEVVGWLSDTACSQLETLARQQESGFTEFARFQADVEGARSIFVGQPVTSSAAPPGAISDSETLARAKELLSHGVPMAQLEDGSWSSVTFSSDSRDMGRSLTQEDLEYMLYGRGYPLVLCPDGAYQFDEAYQYYLCLDEGKCYVLRWEAEREENPIRPVACFSADVLSPLIELARGEGQQDQQEEQQENGGLQRSVENCRMIELSFDYSLPLIDDPELLGQARAVLLYSGDPERKPGRLFNVGFLVNDDGVLNWHLYWIDNQTMIEELRALGNRQKELLLGGLTREQVDQANEAFRSDMELPDGSSGPSEISCFFTSNYSDPTQIDLEEFLRYCPLAEGVDEQADREEYRKVLDASFWAEDVSDLDGFLLPTPMWRYPREKVSALLEKYTGVTVDQLDWGDMLYLEEYDAFYNFTSDYGPGFFPCAGGEILGDTVQLWSVPNANGRCRLTLHQEGDRWQIQSFRANYDR